MILNHLLVGKTFEVVVMLMLIPIQMSIIITTMMPMIIQTTIYEKCTSINIDGGRGVSLLELNF